MNPLIHIKSIKYKKKIASFKFLIKYHIDYNSQKNKGEIITPVMGLLNGMNLHIY